jgi:hypothetical protein
MESFGLPSSANSGSVQGVDYIGLPSLNPEAGALVTATLRRYDPALAFVAAEDTTGQLLNASLAWSSGRTIVLVQTPDLLPGMPLQGDSPERFLSLLRCAAGVVATSGYVHGLVSRLGLTSVQSYLPVHRADSRPIEGPGRSIVMVNPCAHKGIDLLEALALRRPEYRFRAVSLWGTTPADADRLRRHPNIELVPPVDDLRELWQLARCLVLPSTWHENFPLTLIDALLHGVPAVTSDVGALGEAGLGVTELLPALMPNSEPARRRAVTAKWLIAIDNIMKVDAVWTELSDASRQAALSFIDGLSLDAFMHRALSLTRRAGSSCP